MSATGRVVGLHRYLAKQREGTSDGDTATPGKRNKVAVAATARCFERASVVLSLCRPFNGPPIYACPIAGARALRICCIVDESFYNSVWGYFGCCGGMARIIDCGPPSWHSTETAARVEQGTEWEKSKPRCGRRRSIRSSTGITSGGRSSGGYGYWCEDPWCTYFAVILAIVALRSQYVLVQGKELLKYVKGLLG